MTISAIAMETRTRVVSNWIFIDLKSSGVSPRTVRISSSLRVENEPFPASGVVLALTWKATPMPTMTMPITTRIHWCQYAE